MVKSSNKFWSAILIICTALLMGGFLSAGGALRAQEEPPPPEQPQTPANPPRQQIVPILQNLVDQFRGGGGGGGGMGGMGGGMGGMGGGMGGMGGGMGGMGGGGGSTRGGGSSGRPDTGRPDTGRTGGSSGGGMMVSPVPGMPPTGDQLMQFNFDNVDLSVFVNEVSGALGITPIIIDSDVRGSVTVVTSTPMRKKDVFILYTLVLKNNNAALVFVQGIYQIIPIARAIQIGVPVIDKLPDPSSEKPAPSSSSSESSPAKGDPSSLRVSFSAPKADPAKATADAGEQKQPGASTEAPKADPEKTPASAPKTTSQPARGGRGDMTLASASASSTKDIFESTNVPRLATHVVRVNFVPVKDLIEPIKLFMTNGGVIMPYERLNMLILTDYTDVTARITQLIALLDNNYLDPELVDLVYLKNNTAGDIVDDLNKIFQSGVASQPTAQTRPGTTNTSTPTGSTTGVSFIAMDRLNAIFVVASTKRGLSEIKTWIAKLDTTSEKRVQTFYYPVQNTTASTISLLISNLLGASNTNQQGGMNRTTGTTQQRGTGTGTGTGTGAGGRGGGGAGAG